MTQPRERHPRRPTTLDGTDANAWRTCDNRLDVNAFPGPAPEAGAGASSTDDDRSHVMTAAADRHLLFGLLALQNGLIDQGQLILAFQAWARDKSRSLAAPLVALGDLHADACAGLEPPQSHPSS